MRTLIALLLLTTVANAQTYEKSGDKVKATVTVTTESSFKYDEIVSQLETLGRQRENVVTNQAKELAQIDANIEYYNDLLIEAKKYNLDVKEVIAE